MNEIPNGNEPVCNRYIHWPISITNINPFKKAGSAFACISLQVLTNSCSYL